MISEYWEERVESRAFTATASSRIKRISSMDREKLKAEKLKAETLKTRKRVKPLSHIKSVRLRGFHILKFVNVEVSYCLLDELREVGIQKWREE